MDTLERKLPIGIQTFEKMRTEGCLYVDKTDIVYQIAATKVPYFLSRPRRFGKVCFFPLSKPTFKVGKTCLQAWLLKSWKRNGNNILFCILI